MHDSENVIIPAERIPWNKGQADRRQAAAQAKTCLGHPNEASDRRAKARPGAVQSRDR